MKTFKNTSSLTNFTLVNDTIQLKLNFNTEIYIQNDVKLRLVKNIIERLNLTELKKVYSSFGRKPTVNPVTMLEIIIFCYSEGIFTSREIEKSCKYDLRIRYLLDGSKAPDHTTINRFRQKILELTPDILKQMIQILIEENQIDLSSIYIDGTKIEAYANRYSFVWRGSIEKWQEKLIEKIKEELGFRESLKYDEKQDKYISQEGKEFIRCNDRYRKRKSVYVTTTKVYRCFDWNKEGQKTKGIYISETFQKYREKSLKNITSDQGIEERLNRSIQAEGAFSKIKSGLNYNRFHHRGKENIISEICLLSIGLNLNKLVSKI